MKRMIGIALMLGALCAHAEKELRVIDLGEGPVTAENAEKYRVYLEEQEAAANIPPAEAMEFIYRLDKTVAQGIQLTKSGVASGVAQRNQAIALNKLMDEGKRFGTLFAPFAQCYGASIDAVTSWQAWISRQVDMFTEYHNKYVASAEACLEAAR
jgi:hypothetical protein